MNTHHHTEKREHILQVAEELFAENGFDGTSVRMLAEAAKVNLAMISYYFGSKEKLFETLVETRTSVLREILKTITETIPDPLERLEAIMVAYMDRILNNTRFHRIIHRQISLQSRSEMNETIINILMKNGVSVAEVIMEGQKSGVFRKDIDIPLTIMSLKSPITQFAMNAAFCTRLAEMTEPGFSMDGTEGRERIKKHLFQVIQNHIVIHKDKLNNTDENA